MRGLFISLAIVAAIALVAADFESDWSDFKVNYGRHYGSPEEESFRKDLFRKTWEMVKEHNEKYARHEVTWEMGINNFADMTDEEKKRYLGFQSTFSSDLDSEWDNFKVKFNKKYGTPEEEAYRKGIFLKNLEAIDAHNKQYEKGEVTWKMGVNPYTDLSLGEFAKTHLLGPAQFSEEDFHIDWEDFKATFGRHYENSVEEAFRMGIFRVNWEKIIQHNRKFDKKEVTWKMGANNFTDWSGNEFRSHLAPLAAYSTSFDGEWEQFKLKFSRSYESPEVEAFRKGIFLKNWEMIAEHNKKFEKKEVSWQMGVNNFTDYTQEEFGTRLMNPTKFSQEQYEADWKNFKVTYGRVYENSVEEAFRRGIFRWNWERIVKHNERYQKGEISWKMGVNNFTDWTQEEFGSHVMPPFSVNPNDV